MSGVLAEYEALVTAGELRLSLSVAESVAIVTSRYLPLAAQVAA